MRSSCNGIVLQWQWWRKPKQRKLENRNSMIKEKLNVEQSQNLVNYRNTVEMSNSDSNAPEGLTLSFIFHWMGISECNLHFWYAQQEFPFFFLHTFILGFHQSSDQNKNRNHSINKFKNLVVDCNINNLAKNWVSAVFHSRSVSPKFVQLCMETPCWCPSEGHKHGGRKPTETSVTGFCYKSVNLSLEELKMNTALLSLRQELFRWPNSS